MAKQSGLGDQLFIGGVDIGADINQINSLATPRGVLDATGITQFANARMFGLRDANAEFTAYFNPETDGTHEELSSLPRTDVQVTYLRGVGVGSPSCSLVGLQTNYDANRGDDGSFLFTVQVPSSKYGADWGVQLTNGAQAFATAADGDSVDLGAATAFGFQVYVHAFSIGSGTAELTLETSSDDGDTDAFAPLAGTVLSDVSAPGAYRFQSVSDTAAVERYIRLSVGGTFTDLVVAVCITVNQAQRAI